MTIYNVIHCVYDCFENYCHDGDPVIYVNSFADMKAANKYVDNIVRAYESDIDEDGEPQEPYDCERTGTGAVCTSHSALVEAVISIEKTELA